MVLGAVAIGITLVYGLSLFGDKSSGPIQDLFNSLNKSVHDLEGDYILKRRTVSRAQRLDWLAMSLRNTDSLKNQNELLLGAYDNRADISLQPIIDLEDSLQTTFSLIHNYIAWGTKREQRFPIEKVRSISTLGSIPVITWEPWLNDFTEGENADLIPSQDPNKNGLKRIAEGKYDDYLRQWAIDSRNSGITILLRLGHEMNDPYRYPWGPQNNQPGDFIAAWRHVVNLFRQENVTNIVWVWAPHLAYGEFDAFYPGDEWVDWTGTGTLNYGTVAPWSQWWTFEEIFGKHYADLEAFDKPILIAEFGSLAVGGNRSKWYADAFADFEIKYPKVKGLIFFHHGNDASTTYQSLNWQITAEPAVLDSIRTHLNK